MIQHLKHNMILVLKLSTAVLDFWFCALIFVVYCLNHIVKKPLICGEYLGVLNGDTTNISPFIFRFWQPVKFFDKVKLPNIIWAMDGFIGTVWDTGDMFTFNIWS